MISALLSLALSSAFALSPEQQDAVSLGNCTLLESQLTETPEHALALALCARPSDPDRALRLFDEVSEGVLRDYARWKKAELLSSQGKHQEALSSLEGLSLPGSAGLQLRLTRARTLLALERSLDARDDLRKLLETSVGVEARYLLAVGGQQRGDLVPAISTYRKTWALAVRGPWAALSAQALAGLGSPVPDPTSPEGQALIRERISNLKKVHGYAEILELTLSMQPHLERPLSDAELGRAYYKARKYPEAIETWAKAFGAPSTASGPSKSLFDYALGTSRTGDYASAAQIYSRLIDQHPTSSSADEALFKLGYLPYDEGKCEEAIPRFQTYLKTHPDGNWVQSSLWFLGRCQFATEQWANAIDTWQQLEKRFPKSKLASGSLYWAARAHGKLGDTSEEEKHLDEVLSRYPSSLHAWFVTEERDTKFPAKPRVSAPSWPASWASKTEVTRASTLLEAGFGHWAAEELLSLWPELKAADKATRLAAAHRLIKMGRVKEGRLLALRYCVSPEKGGDAIAQQACYPLVTPDLVTPIATEAGLDPLLPNSIMLVESALDPSATSLAGARGLMQLMPENAEIVHKTVLPGEVFDADRLYDAPYNTFLGVNLMARDTRAFQDTLTYSSLPAVIAAYNGGTEAVERWLKKYPSPAPVDVFSEDISYTETRRYVRSVLGHLMSWKWVYGEQ